MKKNQINLWVVLFLTILLSIFSVQFVNGEASYLGEKLLAYFESLPESFSIIWWEITPISEKNINILSQREERNIYSPCISLNLFIKTPQERIIEVMRIHYDLSKSTNLFRSITVGDREKTCIYYPISNVARIGSLQSIYFTNDSIMDIISPIDCYEWFHEKKLYMKNNYETEGNAIKFTHSSSKIKLIYVMSDESCLCPPIERKIISPDGKIRSKFSITSKEYNSSDGRKIIFPQNIVKSWGENFKDKTFFEIIHFDVLDNDIIENLFSLEILDGAYITDERLEINYMKNSEQQIIPKDIYPTKFTYFGLSYERVLEMID
ncbi:hypothetical protein JW926_00685, partial [Candidatus Sumerlaeota bacterium]|nr:hypothetical protein [Candidatus Sumerlaeota bacterium]